MRWKVILRSLYSYSPILIISSVYCLHPPFTATESQERQAQNQEWGHHSSPTLVCTLTINTLQLLVYHSHNLSFFSSIRQTTPPYFTEKAKYLPLMLMVIDCLKCSIHTEGVAQRDNTYSCSTHEALGPNSSITESWPPGIHFLYHPFPQSIKNRILEKL